MEKLVSAEQNASTKETFGQIEEIFNQILNVNEEDEELGFMQLGGDSIKALLMVNRIKEMGYDLEINELMELNTITKITDQLLRNGVNNAWQKEQVARFELRRQDTLYLYNSTQSIIFQISKYIESVWIEAFTLLLKQHDLLRGYLIDEVITIQPSEQYIVTVDELEVSSTLEEELATYLQRIDDHKVIHMVHCKSNGNDYIAIIGLMEVLDNESFEILKKDLLYYYCALKEKCQDDSQENSEDKINDEITINKKTAPYTEWINLVQRYHEINVCKCTYEDVANDNESIQYGVMKKITQVEEINQIDLRQGVTYNDLFLAAYYKTINDYAINAKEKQYITIIQNGRQEDIQELTFSNTIGNFNYIRPIPVEKLEDVELYIIKSREMLKRGLTYGLAYPSDEVDLTRRLTYAYYFKEQLTSSDTQELQNEILQTKLSEVKLQEELTATELKNNVVELSVQKNEKECLLYVNYNSTLLTKNEATDFLTSLLNNFRWFVRASKESENTYRIGLDYGLNSVSYQELQSIEEKYPSNIERIYRLTPLQKGMLFHKLENKSSTNYHMQYSFDLNYFIDDEYIQDAMNLLIQTHPVLKTTIMYREVYEPVQIIIKHQKPNVHFVKVDTLNSLVSEEYLRKDLEQGFQLDEDPLMKVTILSDKSNVNKNTMIWNFHHIIVDGWSIGLIFRDFFAYYQQLAYGDDVFIHSVPYYENYVNWIYERNKNEAYEYWRELLKGYTTDAYIRPIKVNKANSKKFVLAQLGLDFDLGLCDSIRQFSAQYSFTQSQILEVAWGILLQKYTYTDDVIFGKVVSGRNAKVPMIEETVGLYINTIPVRVEKGNMTTFLELLCQQKEKDDTSLPYQWCSLYDLQQNSDFKTSHIKTLYVCENFYNMTEDQLKKNGIDVQSRLDETNFDITVIVTLNDKVNVSIVYNKNMYEEDEIKRILELLEVIVEKIVTNPNCIINEQSIITQKVEESVLRTFNKPLQEKLCVHSIPYLLNDIIRNFGENCALQDDCEAITYCELGNRINNIAGYLNVIGLQEGDRIAVMAHKNVDTILAICAIIYIGAAYIPIDSNDPIERKSKIIKDCSPSFILIQDGDDVPDEVPKIYNSNLRNITYDYSFTNTVNPNSIAYIMYTSGTTGQPKGVMVEQRSIVRLVHESEFVPLNTDTRMLETGSIAFDASTFEIWGSLLNGGTLFLYETDRILNPERLKADIVTNRINTMWVTSSLFNQLITTKEDIFDSLEYLLIGGEKLSIKHVNMFTSRDNQVVLINGYGPTENTTFTTTYKIPKQVDRIPIGKPITNTTVYIMQYNQLCGIGMIGELYAGGYGVARGYYNNEELTREKFMKDPYSTGYLYKTGDLARWLPDGNIEYIKRIDEQFKIRGFRIELDEIEETLMKHECIEQAVVSVTSTDNGEKQLNAYYKSAQAIDPMNLVGYLKDKLPGYMIPRYYLQVDNFPLNKNGKIDKYELPIIQNPISTDYIAPRDEIEYIIANIYQKVLLVDQVGIHDDFFDQGGHSIRATVVINAIERELNIRLQIKDIMENPTVEKLALLVKTNKKKEIVHIEKAKPALFYEASEAQKRVYVSANLDSKGLVYNMPMTIILPDDMDRERVEEAFNIIISRHEAFRTSFKMIDNKLMQCIAVSITFTVEYQQVLDYEIETERQRFIQPFHLETAPLLRVKILKSSTTNLLLIDMHHIISDGASVSILMSELMKLYKNEQLQPIKLQYKDYSEWFRKVDFSKQKEYWLTQFKDEIPDSMIPTDHKRGRKRDFTGSSYTIIIPSESTKQFKMVAKEEGVTEYMLFLSVLMVLISKISGKQDIVIGSPFSGRVYSDIEQTIGMFVNTLAMRGKPQQHKSFKEFLTEIRNLCFDSYENQEYPFDRLVEDLNVKKEISRNPIFDVLMVLQNNETCNEFDENGFKYYTEKSIIAKFDITVDIEEVAKEYNIKFEYATALYDENTIIELSQQYKYLLEHVQTFLQEKISNIDIQKNREEDALSCIQELF